MERGRAQESARLAGGRLTLLFHELLLEGARRHGRKAALVDAATGRGISFGEIPDAVDGLARRLRAIGLEPGVVVALLGRNSPQFPLLVCGVLAAGGAVAPVNPYFHPHEVAAQTRASGASFLLADAGLVERATACAAASGFGSLFVFDEVLSLREISCGPVTASARADGAESGDALLAWSVGPGGLPAPARHSHASLSAALLGLAAVAPWFEDDVVFSAISPYDLYGLVATLALSLHLGTTAVTASRFDVPSFAAAVRQWGVTVSNVVPTIVRALAESPVFAGGLGPLRLLISGGAPLAPRVAGACATRFGVNVVQGYGLAEGAGATHVDAPVHEARVESCGRPVSGLATRVVAADGLPVRTGAVGELWLRGEQVFRGYRGSHAKTEAALTPEGWLRTGDLVLEDRDRRMTVVGRRKAVVKVRGFQVSPAEVERELLAHPAVREAAVYAEWDEVSGEESAAAEVVPRHGVEAAELAAWLSSRLARHKRPSTITLVAELTPREENRFLPWRAAATS